MGIKEFIGDAAAIAEKELKLELRFKIPFFTGHLVEPVIRIMPFLLVYSGFFVGGAKSFGGVTAENFAVFLLLGLLTDLFLVNGYMLLYSKFMMEKFWQTIEGILLAPISKFAILGGQALSILVSLIPSMALFLGVSYVLMPIPALNVLVCLMVTLMVLSISLSMGLVHASSALFNENFSPLFRYVKVGLVFVSCFYYPITLFDQIPALSILKPLVLFNPLYQAVFAMRSAWISGVIVWGSIAYVAIFAVIAPLTAVFIFNKLWKWLNIQGY